MRLARSKRTKILAWSMILLCAIAFSNILVVEVAVGRKLAKLHIGMTRSEVIDAVGEPHDNTVAKYYDDSSGQRIHVGDKRHYRYYFSYLWDYVLLFPLDRAKGIQIVFGEDGRVEQIETRGYLSRNWYVRSNRSDKTGTDISPGIKSARPTE